MRVRLILLPGMLCDGTVWEGVIAALSDIADCHVIPCGRQRSIAEMAAAVAKQIDGPVGLMGHSLGGRVAFEVQRLRPDMVTRLGILNASASGHRSVQDLEQEVAVRAGQLSVIRRDGMLAFARGWAQSIFGGTALADRELMAAFDAMISRQSDAHFEAQAIAGLTRRDMMEWLKDIECPVLVIGGEHESSRPPETHKAIAAAIPNARCEIVEDAAHMTIMEKPAAVAMLIRGFLKSPVIPSAKPFNDVRS